MKNCVYMYTNKINGKKYIGQAINFNGRHKQHIRTSFDKKSKDYTMPFHNAIRKYGIKNFEYCVLISDLTPGERDFWEIYFIAYYDTLVKNNKGYNVASGGSKGNNFEGKTEEEMQEIKRKIGEKSKGRQAHLGKKHTKETKKVLSKKTKERYKNKEHHPMYGKHHTEEAKKRNSESRKGKCTGTNNPKSRKVAQYTLDGTFIKEYDYIKQAMNETGAKAITAVCKGRRKTSGGYIWKYID